MQTSRHVVRVRGVVQGVGFRPFVYGQAVRLGLAGFVGNDSDGLFIEVEGTRASIDALVDSLTADPPPLARVESVEQTAIEPVGETTFRIVGSRRGAGHSAAVTADAATCAACLAELHDPANRRYGYPFVNCTNCGPRLTIVTDVPYDRPSTTMAGFAMCAACRAEYDDPADRRFHAQPTCCPDCGPRLTLLAADGAALAGPAAAEVDVRALIAATRELLLAGKTVAVKGIGGYHLAVDATDTDAVDRLRTRKHREERPFAVMVRDLDEARRLCAVGPLDAAALTAPAAPIVLLPRLPDDAVTAVAPSVAPGHRTLGLMLPYTPLHHLLLAAVDRPLVLTSGNVSDEPVVIDDADALDRLAGLADAFVVHDRPIRTRVDDSVVRAVPGGLSPVRRSRGYVPGALTLPWRFPRHVLGCGPELKATFCLGRDERAVLSHHIGDLENYETLTSYVDGIAHLSRLFDVQPELLAHDLHPDYLSTAWAGEQPDVELLGVQHHHAHIASCLAEHGVAGPVIGVAFDGTGFGTDGTLWGGEFLVADLRTSRRVAHLEAVPLPGGARAIREPWRCAAAYLEAAFGPDGGSGLAVRERHADRWDAVAGLARGAAHAPLSSSAGRLFDAVASLLGVRDTIGYEGQAAIELELVADPRSDGRWPVTIDDSRDPWVVRGTDLVRGVIADLTADVDPAAVAGRFHASLAAVTTEVCRRLREAHDLPTVALSGGVFQNVLLTTRCVESLEAQGFTVLTHHVVPPNDGGVSLGQAVVAGALDRDPG
jgi:hydrogenase maturation protein HypF